MLHAASDLPVNPPEPGPAAPIGQAPRRTLPVERIGALIEVLLCSGFPTQILVLSALTAFGMQPRTEAGGFSTAFITTMSFVDMVLVLGLVFLFVRAHGESVRDFVFGGRRVLREALIGIALVPVTLLLAVLVLVPVVVLKPELNNVPVNPFEALLQTPREAAIFAFVVVFAGGVREEIQRAFIVRRFDRYLGGAAAGILIYSVFFGLGHIEQGYAAMIVVGVLGASWGLLYWTRRSIVAPIVCHAGFNLMQLAKYLALAG